MTQYRNSGTAMLLRRFVLDICAAKFHGRCRNYIETAVVRIREQVGREEVILGLSGGSIPASLLRPFTVQ